MIGSDLFPCGVCESPLSLVPDCRPLLFHCDSGHWCSIEMMLRRWLPAERRQSERTLRGWEARARVLQEFVRCALVNGHAFSAADLQDAAEQILRRVREVRRFMLLEYEIFPANRARL